MRVTYGPTTFEEFGANVNWEPDDDNIGGKLYLKLDDTSNPPLTTHQIKITYRLIQLQVIRLLLTMMI